jgi:hypothetical protein
MRSLIQVIMKNITRALTIRSAAYAVVFLNEKGGWRKALAAGLVGATMLGAPVKGQAQEPTSRATQIQHEAAAMSDSDAIDTAREIWNQLSDEQKQQARPAIAIYNKQGNYRAEVAYLKLLLAGEQLPAVKDDINARIAAAEKELSEVWQDSNPKIRALERADQLQWIKQKDAATGQEKFAMIKARIAYLLKMSELVEEPK